MKNLRATLSLETLEDRSLLSASPWAEFAPPAPEAMARGASNNIYRNVDISPAAMQRSRGFQSPVETTTFISLAPGGTAAAFIVGHTTVANPSWTAARRVGTAMTELTRKTLENALTEPNELAAKLKDIWGGSGSESGYSIPAQIIARATGTAASVVSNVFTPWTARTPGSAADQDGFTVIVVTDHGQSGR